MVQINAGGNLVHTNDCKHAFFARILGHGGHIDDLEVEFLQNNGAVSDNVEDAWVEFMIDKGIAKAQINDMFADWHTLQNAPFDNLADNWRWIWCTLGPGVGLVFTADTTDVTWDSTLITLDATLL